MSFITTGLKTAWHLFTGVESTIHHHDVSADVALPILQDSMTLANQMTSFHTCPTLPSLKLTIVNKSQWGKVKGLVNAFSGKVVKHGPQIEIQSIAVKVAEQTAAKKTKTVTM